MKVLVTHLIYLVGSGMFFRAKIRLRNVGLTTALKQDRGGRTNDGHFGIF